MTDATDKMVVHYSALDNVENWTSPNNAGYIDLSYVLSRADEVLEISSYINHIVFFCRYHIVIYSGTNPTPEGDFFMKQNIKSTAITSRISKKRRAAILKSMKEGQIQVLFATKLADEGLDIPRLNRLFLTCPIRSVNKINQQLGRIQRKFPGKKDAVVFDFRDSLVSLAESQYTTRLKQVYHEYDVIEVPYAR